MEKSQWTWADLNGEQLSMLKEAEGTLGEDFLLAYRQNQQAAKTSPELFPAMGLRVAPLNGSQIECLEGLEKKLRLVVVAYQKM